MNRHLAFACVVVGALIFALFATGAHSHDHNRPELDSWFTGLKSGKGPCCDASEATRVDDADWETRDGHYRVRIDNLWHDVPDDAVITEPNKAGRTMVWPIIDGVGGVYIRCFMPGSMT